MRKSNVILRTLSILTGVAVIGAGGASFVLDSGMSIILKLLILLSGAALLLLLILLAQIAEGVVSLAEEYKNGAQLRKESGGHIKDSMEILEAINVVELKKNKSVKDIADILAEAAPILKEKSESGISTEKIEQLLIEISENIKNLELKSVQSFPNVQIEQLKEEVQTVGAELSLENVNLQEEKEVADAAEESAVLEELADSETEKEFAEESHILEEESYASVEDVVENEAREEKQIPDKYELTIENEFGIDEEEELNSEELSEDKEESSINMEEIQSREDQSAVAEIAEETEIGEEVIEKKEVNEEERIEVEEGGEKAPIQPVDSIKIMSASDYFEEEENVEYTPVPEKKEIKNDMLFGLMAEELVPKKEKKSVYFSDVRLEELIRDMIDKPTGDIAEDEIADITELKAGNRGIKKLEGIENIVNLEELDLWKAEISDISLLANLKKLVYLRLSKTGVKDLTPLKELPNLEELYLQEIPATDLTPVGELKSLKMLYLEKTKFDSLEPLLLIPDLQELYLWGADIGSETNKIVMRKLEEKGCRITK